MRRLIPLVCPALVGAGVWLQLPLLALVGCVMFGAQLLWPALHARKHWAWSGLLGIAGLGLPIALHGDGRHVMQLISLVISGLFLLIFLRSLRPGGIALATRVAAAARGIGESEIHRLDPSIARYTRGVTWMWAGMFALFVVQSLWATFFAVPTTTGLLIDIGNFVLVCGLMAGEYAYHSRRFPNPRHRSFLDFARDVASLDYGRILND